MVHEVNEYIQFKGQRYILNEYIGSKLKIFEHKYKIYTIKVRSSRIMEDRLLYQIVYFDNK